MGGIYSIQKIFDESEGEEEAVESTPIEPLRNKRLLTLDPRSPSEGITRTPIIVDRTPNAVNNRLKMAHLADETPRAVPSIKDPRSPSNEFTRTPINPCFSSALARLETPVTTRAAADADVSPVYSVACGSESGIESADVSPVLTSNNRVSGHPTNVQDSPDSAFSVGMDHQAVIPAEKSSDDNFLNQISSTCDTADTRPTSPPDDDSDDENNDSCDVEEVPSLEIENICLSTQPVKSQDESTPVLHSMIRSRPQVAASKKPRALSLTPGVTRSPLSLVENSARALSQRNNMMTPQGVKTSQAVNARVVDKENIFH